MARRRRLPRLEDAKSEFVRLAALRQTSAPHLTDDERAALRFLGRDRTMQVADEVSYRAAAAVCERLGEVEARRLAASLVVSARADLLRCEGSGFPRFERRVEHLRATVDGLTADYHLPTEPARKHRILGINVEFRSKWPDE